MNKNESKYFNTAVRMDEALISLLEKKDFAYITLKEICDKADVNRSTFYLHYDNTSDLLEEATKHILNGFLSYFSCEQKSIAHHLSDIELEELVYIKPEYITPYLTFIKENRRIFKTSLKHLGTMGFDDVYDRMFKHIFAPILTRFRYCEKEQAYVMKFYLSGITAIVMEWIENNCEDSIEFITKTLTDCIFGKQNPNG